MRKLDQLPEQTQPKARDLLRRISRILTQKPRDKIIDPEPELRLQRCRWHAF